MGTRRQQASDQWRLRLSLDSEDQDTLIPCKACGTDGHVVVDGPGGTYRTKKCVWCDDGYTSREIVGMFQRWVRILKRNQKAGKCP